MNDTALDSLVEMQLQYIASSQPPVSNLKRKSESEEMLSDSEEVFEVLRRIKKIKFPVYIKIQTLNGRTFDVDLDSHDTVERLKELVFEKEGIPVHQQKLVFKGKQLLKDQCSVDSYGVVDGCVIFLIVALPHINGYTGISHEHRSNDDY